MTRGPFRDPESFLCQEQWGLCDPCHMQLAARCWGQRVRLAVSCAAAAWQAALPLILASSSGNEGGRGLRSWLNGK